MELSLSLWVRDHLLLVDIGSGLFLGAMMSYLSVVVFCRMSRISSIPTSLIPEYVGNALYLTVVRFFILFPFVGIAAFVCSPWTTWTLQAPDILGYSPKHFSHRSLFIGFPIVFLFSIQYRMLILFLDSRWGLAIKPFRNSAAVQQLKGGGLKDLIRPPVEEGLLQNLVLATTADPLITRPISYGGIFGRPRIVVPQGLEQRYQDENRIPLLLLEIAHIRRGDAHFQVFIQSLRFLWKRLFYKTFLDKTFFKSIILILSAPVKLLNLSYTFGCDRFCIADVVGRVPLELMIRSMVLEAGKSLQRPEESLTQQEAVSQIVLALSDVDKKYYSKMLWIGRLSQEIVTSLQHETLIRKAYRSKQIFRWVSGALVSSVLGIIFTSLLVDSLHYHRELNKRKITQEQVRKNAIKTVPTQTIEAIPSSVDSSRGQ